MADWQNAPAVNQQGGAAWQSAPVVGAAVEPPTPEATPTQKRSLSDITLGGAGGIIGNAVVDAAGQTARRIDDVVRSIASGVSFGFADEAAAAANAALGSGDYKSNLEVERARDKEIPANVAIPGQIAGAVATGGALARGGLTLMNAAKPTLGAMVGRGAAEGALYGAAHGAGAAEGDAKSRAEGAAWGSLLGALTGGVGGVAGTAAASKAKASVPTARQLKAEGSRLYDKAWAEGVEVTPQWLGGLSRKMAQKADDFGFDDVVHPLAARALKRVDEAAAGPLTLQKVENLRIILKEAKASTVKSERKLGEQLMQEFDSALNRMTPGDVTAGNVKEATSALSAAREVWKRASKGEQIDDLIMRAHERASQFSGSGLENALRTEFRNLAMNAKKMRTFTKAEQEAIRLVGQGAPLENALRHIGKFAPTGVVSTGIGAGAGYGIAGPAGAVALPAIGAASRVGATKLTEANARGASELMRSGGNLPTLNRLSQRGIMALGGAGSGGAAGGVGTLRALADYMNSRK